MWYDLRVYTYVMSRILTYAQMPMILLVPIHSIFSVSSLQLTNPCLEEIKGDILAPWKSMGILSMTSMGSGLHPEHLYQLNIISLVQNWLKWRESVFGGLWIRDLHRGIQTTAPLRSDLAPDCLCVCRLCNFYTPLSNIYCICFIFQLFAPTTTQRVFKCWLNGKITLITVCAIEGHGCTHSMENDPLEIYSVESKGEGCAEEVLTVKPLEAWGESVWDVLKTG